MTKKKDGLKGQLTAKKARNARGQVAVLRSQLQRTNEEWQKRYDAAVNEYRHAKESQLSLIKDVNGLVAVLGDYEREIKHLIDDRERLLNNLRSVSKLQRAESLALDVYRSGLLKGISSWKQNGSDVRHFIRSAELTKDGPRALDTPTSGTKGL